MTDRRRGLGRGLGALIPTGPMDDTAKRESPVDVFFPGGSAAAGTQ
jgi:ParB family transcriptional regulator, chromosome partitioning protein